LRVKNGELLFLSQHISGSKHDQHRVAFEDGALKDGVRPELPKTNRVVTGNNSRHGKGLGKPCHFCQMQIEEFPYFSHLSGGDCTHYYHIACAKKIRIL
jgi:hypothetical protein